MESGDRRRMGENMNKNKKERERTTPRVSK